MPCLDSIFLKFISFHFIYKWIPIFGNKVKNKDFNSFVNELFCLKYIKKIYWIQLKVDFDGIIINKYWNEVKIINITCMSYQMKWILMKSW